ncbi:hypothetical protein BOW53_09990 [Solemya pervernicosa gill symbiont]|uniref:Uncharacterized protein n=1 Tax=Solemya pervernicosa gill symbiont TaxID=642797 RepID=A0A1T2L416_9GAMM|nr:hypothetical protein [Solemya pervernicosa gill symbiont]OOZ39845.1 hypothetical protein BOW53_09990 [Solemya pervernicosa gill symbiont]
MKGGLILLLALLVNPVMAEVNETKRELLIENVLLRALLLSMNDQEMFETIDWHCSGQTCNTRNSKRVEGNIRKLYEGIGEATLQCEDDLVGLNDKRDDIKIDELTEFEVNSIGDHTHFRIYKEYWVHLSKITHTETGQFEYSSSLLLDKFKRERNTLVSCPAIVKAMVESLNSTSLKLLDKVHEEEGSLCGRSRRFKGCLKQFAEVSQEICQLKLRYYAERGIELKALKEPLLFDD